jgi:hypothetical protein
MRLIARIAFSEILGGTPRRMRLGKVPASLFLDIESQYVSDDGSRAPLAESYDELDNTTGFGGLGCIAEDGVESVVDDDEKGYTKPVCRRPAPVYGVPRVPSVSVSVMPALAAVREVIRVMAEERTGPGCCKTTVQEKKQMRKRYKKNRKKELAEDRKRRMKVRPETRNRPGGKSGDKRKRYKRRDYPTSIRQPERQPAHEVKTQKVSPARPVNQPRQVTVKPTVQVKVINPRKASDIVECVAYMALNGL